MQKIKSKVKGQRSKVIDQKLNVEKAVMEKIRSEKVAMKPRWHFVVGSIFMAMGLASLSMGAIFLTNLTLFLLRKRGPGFWRLEMMFDNFPWWIPVVAVLGIVLGIWLLRKYDISYKKNFLTIIIGFIASIIIFAWLMDKMGLNETWSTRGPMSRFYQKIEGQSPGFNYGPDRGLNYRNGKKLQNNW